MPVPADLLLLFLALPCACHIFFYLSGTAPVPGCTILYRPGTMPVPGGCDYAVLALALCPKPAFLFYEIFMN